MFVTSNAPPAFRIASYVNSVHNLFLFYMNVGASVQKTSVWGVKNALSGFEARNRGSTPDIPIKFGNRGNPDGENRNIFDRLLGK